MRGFGPVGIDRADRVRVEYRLAGLGRSTAHARGPRNVFGPHLDGFETKLLRLSSGIGLRTNGESGSRVQILTGFGTDTIARLACQLVPARDRRDTGF